MNLYDKKTDEILTLKDLVYIRKTAIREGLLREMEDTRKGSLVLVLVLMANADDESKIVEMTYKEMRQQTGYTKELIRQILNVLEIHKFIVRESNQGSRKTRMRILM